MAAEQNSGPDKDESCWLVKSGDRILGPFSREEIKNKLYEKELVVIDEIITPMRRWRYIRDEPAFAVVVEDIRKSNLGSREDTELGTFANTQTASLATTTTDVTEEIEPVRNAINSRANDEKTDPSMIKDAEIVEEKRSKATRLTPPQAQMKSYGYGSDRRVRRDINRSIRLLWIFTIVVMAGAGFLFYRMQNTRPPEDAGTNMFRLINEAAAARKLGDFKRALVLYEKITSAGYTDPDMMIDTAALRLRTRDFTVPPSRLLDTVQTSHAINSASPETRAKLETVRGLILMIESRKHEEAIAAFNEALKEKEDYAPAAFNKAVANFLSSRYDFTNKQAVTNLASEFTAISEMPTIDATGRIAAKLMAQLVLLKRREVFNAGQVEDALETFKKGIVQYWQEATFLRAYAYYLAQNVVQAQRDLRIMLSADPFVTDEHFTDPMLYTYPLTWQGLRPICEELYRGLSDNEGTKVAKASEPAVEAMWHYCRYRAGDRPDEVRQKMKELEAKQIGDPLMKSVSAFMVMSISPEQAKAKIAEATDDQAWDLGHILRWRMCAKSDLNCMMEGFRKTPTTRPAPIYFRIGAARYYLGQAEEARAAGDRTRSEIQSKLARDTIENVRKLSPNYVPLLVLENELEK